MAGLATYSACSIRGLLAQRAAWTAVALFGPRVLPGEAQRWRPAVPPDAWTALCVAWWNAFGPFDSAAGYERTEVTRPGLALLLLRRGHPVAFVKLREGDAPALHHEGLAMRLMWKAMPRRFAMTEPLTQDTVAGWSYIAAAPMPPGLHAPPRHAPLREITEEISRALTELPKPPQMPTHWRPMHGDFTPWNLRRLRGVLYLMDWENAGWGPPGADEVLYAATQVAISDAAASTSPHREAVRWWADIIGRRDATNERDAEMRARMLRVLGEMGGR